MSTLIGVDGERGGCVVDVWMRTRVRTRAIEREGAPDRDKEDEAVTCSTAVVERLC